MEFITEQADYDVVLTQVSALIDISRRLPAQVFREVPRRLVITDFDLLWDGAAWNALDALATYYRNPEILLMGNPPDGHVWMEDGFSHLGAAVLPVGESGSTYSRLVQGGDPFSALVYEIALVGSSHGFAIWGERHAEVAVCALYDQPERPAFEAPFLLRQFTMDEALGVMAETFVAGLPDGFAEQMRREYGQPGQGPY